MRCRKLRTFPAGNAIQSRAGSSFEIDAQLLALFIEMASLQAKGLRGLCDLAAVPFKFREHLSTLESENPLRERAICITVGAFVTWKNWRTFWSF